MNGAVVDPVSLEPCTDTFFPLASWFTRHHYDAEVVDKLQDIIDNATEDEIEAYKLLYSHYAEVVDVDSRDRHSYLEDSQSPGNKTGARGSAESPARARLNV